MKRHLLTSIALTAVLPLTAVCQELALPEDFLLGGEVSKVLSVNRLNETTLEFTQKVQINGATPLNLATFCTAGWLAHEQGFSLFTLGVPRDYAGPATKLVLTVVFLKDEDQQAKLPTTHKWLEPFDIKKMGKSCAQFLQAKYLWPAE